MSLRDRVVKFVRDYCAEQGRPPSMRCIAKALRVSTKTLYRLFPGGVEEVYRAAGVKREEASPGDLAELLHLYREYLQLDGLEDSAQSLLSFLTGVLEYVRSKLGRAAAERLAQSPLSVFIKVAHLYVEARRSEKR